MSAAVKIVARMSSPVGRAPILDALLIAAAARDAGLPQPAEPPQPGEAPIAPPLVMSNGVYLASAGIVDAVGHQMRWMQRPAPLRRHLILDDARRKLRLTTGPGKPTRAPMRTAIANTVTWYAMATDAAELARLLSQYVTHIGPRRAVGYGNVKSWHVVAVNMPWVGFPVIDPDGAPLRPLPVDWPGVAYVAGRLAHARLLPPYWHGPRYECIVPTWMLT